MTKKIKKYIKILLIITAVVLLLLGITVYFLMGVYTDMLGTFFGNEDNTPYIDFIAWFLSLF